VLEVHAISRNGGPLRLNGAQGHAIRGCPPVPPCVSVFSVPPCYIQIRKKQVPPGEPHPIETGPADRIQVGGVVGRTGSLAARTV
jgi:hypothetical protein